MNRFWATALVLGALVGASLGPVAVLNASTVQGTAVQISGLDDLNATVDNQARKGSGKVLAMALGVGGLVTIGAGHHYLGAAGVGAGLGTAFIPSMMSSAFDSAPAATGVVVEHLASSAWWVPLAALLYPICLAWRILQDPVMLAACAMGIVLVRLVRPAVV
jgi:hypothetical protein